MTEQTEQMTTSWRRLLWMNIRGTPPMRASAVRHDVEVFLKNATAGGAQEFRWPWYWSTLIAAFRRAKRQRGERWKSYPATAVGLVRPVFAGQPVWWRADLYRRRASRRWLLHQGAAGISESRQIRAVLLEDRNTGLAEWVGTTHNVVGGDAPGDSDRRKGILADDLDALELAFDDMTATGHPVAFGLDANIHTGTAAYDRLLRIIAKHNGTIHGHHGVEFTITLPGRGVVAEIRRPWTIPTSRIRTDHEGRGITRRLVRRRAKP